MRISRDSDTDPCPVSDSLLGELYRANKNGLPELIATVSPSARAALALYCYRRGHLKSIGLVIASTCNLYDLETAGGGAGAALYARSREVTPAPPPPSQYVARQKISLATGSLRKSLPIDEDVDLEDDDSALDETAAEATAEPSGAAPDNASDDADLQGAGVQSEPPPSA